MSFRTKRRLLVTGLILLLLSGPLTVLSNTRLSGIDVGSIAFYNLLQRILGLLGFTLIFIQIVSGSLMKKLWVQLLGAYGYRLHIILGITTFVVILLHPLMYYFMGYKLGILTQYILPDFTDTYDNYVSLGRLALLILLLTITAGYFRTRPVFRRIWRKMHVLNYVVYVLIAIHATGVGSDFLSFPFVVVYVISVPAVIASFGYRVYSLYQTTLVGQ